MASASAAFEARPKIHRVTHLAVLLDEVDGIEHSTVLADPAGDDEYGAFFDQRAQGAPHVAVPGPHGSPPFHSGQPHGDLDPGAVEAALPVAHLGDA